MLAVLAGCLLEKGTQQKGMSAVGYVSGTAVVFKLDMCTGSRTTGEKFTVVSLSSCTHVAVIYVGAHSGRLVMPCLQARAPQSSRYLL